MHPDPYPESRVAQKGVIGLPTEGRLAGQVHEVAELVVRAALALGYVETEQAVVPVEEPVEEPGIRAKELGVGQHERAGAQDAGDPEPDSQDLAAKQVEPGACAVALDSRGVGQAGGEAPVAGLRGP